MVARTDLRPTRADDSLKKLLNKVANPQTVPHGVKVAQPGEYVDFYAADGVAHRWDGDAIAEYDNRIAEGAAAVAAAQAHLAEVEADLAEAKERITAYNGDLTLYVERVEAAQAAADAANAALQNLTSELETAQSAVDAVENRTNVVESALADTDAKATQATSDANAAANAAQNALAAAQQVQADAQNALTKAEEAEAKALEAAGIAAGKGKIIYSASEPSGAEASTSNLWIRSSDSKPHRWDGSAWVAITDKAIVDAASAAAAAQGTASKAVADAAAAQAAADTAQAVADSAQAAAQTADAKAVSASNAANTAQTTADKAVSDASTAQAAANAADAKALSAAGIANGKGKVIYSTSAPGTADRLAQNLWVKLPENIPHRWNGSQWVAVTDKTATDAAQAAAAANSKAVAAQATADKAVADAAQAASAAQAANIAAGNAQRTADGKTVALFGTATPPPAPGVTKGDLYYRTGTDNRIIEQWQWSGSAWVKRAIESAQLVNFDAGYITSGFLDVSKRIQAGSIHADKVFVGIGDNLLPPLSMTANYGGQLVGNNLSATGGYTGGVSITLPAGTTGLGSYLSNPTGKGGDYHVKVNPGIPIHASVWVKPGTPAGSPTMFVRFINSVTKAWSFGTPSTAYRDGLPAGEWYNLSGVFTPPANFVYDRVLVGFYANGDHDVTVFSDPAIREMKDGSLIVNGSITGEKVNAESVAAAVGTFVKVNAENVTVTGELAARVVNAMSAQVKNLVVTESSILQHTTLLGETVAEELNVTKTLVARDAILNGTLDVEQLNVTGDMAAQIVSAMSVASKKLIVTEDAILNRATVVQSLVTPELIADRINVNTLGAQLVTSGAIQTDPSANRGVKITNAGVSAWDNNGNQTIRLNGSDNLLMGQLATGDSTVGRIRVFNALHPVNQRPSGFITIQDAGGITASQGVVEYNNSTLQLSIKDGTEQGYSQPFRKGIMVTRDGLVLAGNLTLSGLFNQTESFQAQSNGPYTVNASSFIDVTISFPSSGNRPYIIPSVSFDDAADVNLSLWNVTTTSARIRVYNSSQKTVRGLYVDAIILPLKR